MIRTWIVLGLLLLPVGCVYIPNEKTYHIMESTDEMIRHCRLVGQVFGESEYSYLAMGVEIAKNKAKMEAYKLGATNITWIEVASGVRPYALGRAYVCDKSILFKSSGYE